LLDPWIPYQFFCEEERSATTEIVSVATIFLTNRECPWRCVMCDLWKNTLDFTVPSGAIPVQIDYALEKLPSAQQIKLYNSGSFFDQKAIPREDYSAIAKRMKPFQNVIIECHPALIGDDCLRFQEMIDANLEVAMGLETSNEEVLQKLNKGMTLQQFSQACDFLKSHSIAIRSFILLKPPFFEEDEGLYWAERSIDFAFDCGVDVVTLIPTRGLSAPPKLTTLQTALEYGISTNRGRVFGDLWDLQHFSTCADCFDERRFKLQIMNLQQQIPTKSQCDECGERI
jgi:archaeosine synthase beta-subunit